jgi:hypothetical protein
MYFKACIQVCPKNPVNFNVDNVRVAKLLGGGLHNSCVVRGMVLKNDAVGSIKRVEKAKVILEHIHPSGILIGYLSVMFILLPTLIKFSIVLMGEGIWQLGYSDDPCLRTLSMMIDYFLIHAKHGSDCESIN